MIEIKGRYNSAKIFTDVIDESSIAQIVQLCNQEFASGSSIRMMPDVHAGASCTIGTTMTITDKVIPNLVGVDIGCGMETAKLKEKRIDLTKLDKLIYSAIPSGFSIRKKPHRFAREIDLTALRCYKAVDTRRGDLSIGTLGGGNHFIEAGKAEDGTIYLVVHSGSRHLGLEVAKYYQEQAYHQCNGTDKESIDAAIAQLKAQGREKEIQKTIKSIRSAKRTDIPKAFCYAKGWLFEDYIHDMRLMQQYAALNRQAIMDEMIRGMGLHVNEQFSTIHNYIDTDAMILRKGAVSAMTGQKLIIPINMRDGSLVCVGKGNADWNFSAPHGAGRLMSRSAARQSFTLTQFKAKMEGVYSTSVSRDTIDECPMAYKAMDDIVSNIGPTAEIISVLRPIYNFKSGAGDA
ncbi:MAG: RtcB family protein [Candidatus Gastranaerophilaceae bacterium]|nr:RtcB family protein [Christensenellales bacterium]